MLQHGIASRRAIGAGHEAEMVNRWLVGAIAGAWSHYPSRVELAWGETGEFRDLAGKVLDRLSREDIVRFSGNALALSQSGYAAVEQAQRSDERLADCLRSGALPEQGASSSVVLAILRAQFELSHGAGRQ